MPPLAQPFEFRKVRDFGQLFNALFEFLRSNGKPLGKHLLFIVGPVILLTGIGNYFISENMQHLSPTISTSGEMNSLSVIQEIIPQLFLQLFLFFMSYIALIGIINEYVYVLQNDPENAGDTALIWRNFSSRLGRHTANVLVPGLVMGIPSFIFFVLVVISISMQEILPLLMLLGVFIILPFYVYTGVILSIFPVVRAQENTAAVDGIKRCFALMKDFFWNSFGFFFFVGVAQIILSLIFSFSNMIVKVALPLMMPDMVSSSSDGSGVVQVVHIMTSIISTGGSELMYVIEISAIVIQYFNLVERKEGVGMMSKLDLLGKSDDLPVVDEHDETY